MKKKIQELKARRVYKKNFSADDAVGWDCIDRELAALYGDQEPKHWAAAPHFSIGGTDPLDGISFYKSEQGYNHIHIVSYGMSELYYNPDKAGEEFSRWGFEFTFRLKPFAGDKDEVPFWVIHMMNNLARYVYKSKKWFEVGHFIPALGPIRHDCETKLTGFIFLPDPELGEIDTPHGKVSFLQLFGITDSELEHLKSKPSVENVVNLTKVHRKTNPFFITDLNRS